MSVQDKILTLCFGTSSTFTSQDSYLGTFSRKTSSWLLPEQDAVVMVHHVVLKKVVYVHSVYTPPKEQHEMERSKLLCLISNQLNYVRMKK